MGNCLRKHSLDPNQQPIPESRCKYSTCGGLPVQNPNKLISHNSAAKPIKGGKHGSLRTPKDWPISEVNKVGRLRARKINCFCYGLLKAATHKFSNENLIGQGGFGDVYKGYINLCTMKAAKPDDGRAVAVKKLRRRGEEGHREWRSELEILSRLNHPNVVKLIGYCDDDEHRILVYEYMCKGSLEDNLLKEKDTVLNWSKRIKIAVGAARAVDYLHARKKPLIHRDLKASNFLLDADFNPKLSDFGLARFGPQDEKSYVSTRILGTRGYFDPEYFRTGHLTIKTDVYSFGVVLLEIFCGCSAVKRFSDGTPGDLAQWAKPHLTNKLQLHYIIDKKIARSVRIEEADEFAKIIRQCLCTDPVNRPTMNQVLAELEQLQRNMDSCSLNSFSLRPSTYPKTSFF